MAKRKAKAKARTPAQRRKRRRKKKRRGGIFGRVFKGLWSFVTKHPLLAVVSVVAPAVAVKAFLWRNKAETILGGIKAGVRLSFPPLRVGRAVAKGIRRRSFWDGVKDYFSPL